MDDVFPDVLPYTNHHTICRFSAPTDDAFLEVQIRLREMCTTLLGRVIDAELIEETQRHDPKDRMLAERGKSKTLPVFSDRFKQVSIVVAHDPRYPHAQVLQMNLTGSKSVKPSMEQSITKVSIGVVDEAPPALLVGLVAIRNVGYQVNVGNQVVSDSE